MPRLPDLDVGRGSPDAVSLVAGSEVKGSAAGAFVFLFIAAAIGISWILPPKLPLLVLAYGGALTLVGSAVKATRRELGRAGVVAAVGIGFRANLSGLSVGGKLWGVVAVAACLGVLALVPIGRTSVFPMLHVYCLVQAIYLFVGAFVAAVPPGFGQLYPDKVRTIGFALSALFMGFFGAAGVLWLRIRGSDLAEESRVPEDHVIPSRALVLLIAGTLLAVALSYSPLQARLGALSQVILLVPVVGALALVDSWLRGSLDPKLKVVLIVAGVVYGLAGVGTGLLYRAAGPFISVLALVVVRRRRVPWGTVALAVAATLVMNAAKVDFRNDHSLRGGARGLASAPAFVRSTVGVISDLDAELLARAAYRYSNSDELGYIRDAVPARYPYWDKRTYLAIPFALIPRVLVPFKPTQNFTNEFGRAYGILQPSDVYTAQNITLPVEAYVNFGTAGVVGVGLLGGLYLVLIGILIGRRRSADIILGAVLAAQVVSAVEAGALGFVLTIPFVYVLRPMARWAAPDEAAPPDRDAALGGPV